MIIELEEDCAFKPGLLSFEQYFSKAIKTENRELCIRSMDIKLQANLNETTLSISLVGELTRIDSGSFKNWVTEECAKHEKIEQVLVDCQELHYLDSTGLGAMIFLRKSAVDKGATLTLENVHGWLQKFLQVTALEEIFGLKKTANTE